MKIMQNVLNYWCYETLKGLNRKNEELTPTRLDDLSKELRQDLLNTEGLKPLSETTCREIIVNYATKEFPQLLGLPTKEAKEISDKTIKKMRRARKNNFS